MKKGITLIELLIALGISSMILTMNIVIFSKAIHNYNLNIGIERDNFYVDEAFIFIESKIEEYEKVEIINNKLKLTKENDVGTDWIRMSKSGNIIISYDRCYSINSNNIVKNVRDFKLSNKKNLIYVYIETKKGKSYERCFGIEKKKDLF